MFDIDGTLVDTSSFESKCFIRAINSVMDTEIDGDWSGYPHVSDTGIINELLKGVSDKAERLELFQRIRTNFYELIEDHLRSNIAPEIPGASQFIKHLQRRDDVVLSIATGGWRHTAELKLKSAEINFEDIALASSDDHFDRTEIMKIAQERTDGASFSSRTYFGDGEWDKIASKALGYNFILVGGRTTHYQQIDEYSDIYAIESYIGL